MVQYSVNSAQYIFLYRPNQVSGVSVRSVVIIRTLNITVTVTMRCVK